VTASELAFLGLGLLLGAATGAALIVVLGTRSPRREIRVTVTRDAVPRRSETLSQDAFVTSPSEPARGGPADRRWSDRDDSAPDLGGTVGVPVMGQRVASGKPVGGFSGPSLAGPDRTSVPFRAAAIAVAEAPGLASDEVRPLDDGQPRPPTLSPLERMLRGEHLAMVQVVDAVAGQDGARRRDWELLLGGLVEAMADMATRESVIDFPMGTAFWDTFTVEQCRRIVAALASMGFRYDGRSGWVEHHVPVYRDITNALADIGVDPRRMRAWPNQAEIAALFNGARPAPDELLAAAGPDYHVEDMQMLLGEHASGLAGLWIAWDEARPALLGAGSQPEVALA
jgi:hypothetical protein